MCRKSEVDENSQKINWPGCDQAPGQFISCIDNLVFESPGCPYPVPATMIRIYLLPLLSCSFSPAMYRKCNPKEASILHTAHRHDRHSGEWHD